MKTNSVARYFATLSTAGQEKDKENMGPQSQHRVPANKKAKRIVSASNQKSRQPLMKGQPTIDGTVMERVDLGTKKCKTCEKQAQGVESHKAHDPTCPKARGYYTKSTTPHFRT